MTALAIQFRRRWMTLPNMLWLWHVGLTAMVAWWSFILALPWPTFSVSHAYDRFAAICPDERFWAAGFAIATLGGSASCWAAWPTCVLRGGWRLAAVRMAGTILLAFIHGLVAILMFDGARMSTGPGIYVLIMCSAYLLLRAEYERS